MPLHRGAPRAPKVRWALQWLERKRLMAEILRGMQLMHLYLMLDAFNPMLSTAVLEAKDLPPFALEIGKSFSNFKRWWQTIIPGVNCHGNLFCEGSTASRGNMELFPISSGMELFPISSGGGQFTFVPLSLWYKFATRGCRWICYSNCQSNPSKVQNIFETLFTLDWRM